MSGHIPKGIELRGPHESYLDAPEKFLAVEGEQSTLNGNYVVEDTSRGNIIRYGATDQGFVSRWKEHHSASLL